MALSRIYSINRLGISHSNRAISLLTSDIARSLDACYFRRVVYSTSPMDARRAAASERMSIALCAIMGLS